jgi:hypothetical protein
MVYVDDMFAPFRRMKMCHMIADSTEELMAMADAIGLERRYLQHAGTYREHFDVAQSKRALALHYGAVAITWDALAAKVVAKRDALLQRAAMLASALCLTAPRQRKEER